MPKTTTVAVIDIGSNSIKLLVARHASDGGIETVFTETIETRISKGISSDQPRLTPEAIDAAIRAVSKLLHLANNHHPKAIRIVATSAVRDALNGHEFTKQAQAATGHPIQILDGPEEARLIGCGLATDPYLKTLKHFLQIDLGGGSLELILFHDLKIQQAISLQLGAVRLTEHFLQNPEAPLEHTETEAIQTHVRQALETASIKIPQGQPVIATGGAVVVTRAVLAAQEGLDIQARSPVLTLREISSLRHQLAELPLSQRKTIPQLPPARADILPTALLTIETVLQTARADHLTHSFHNLRYGIADELLEKN